MERDCNLLWSMLKTSWTLHFQLTESVPAGEHHSTHDASWLNSLQPFSSTVPPTTPAGPTSSEQTPTKKATLKDILAQDCPGAEELGYCDSPPRYPM